MIAYDKSIFFINNTCQKVWTLDEHNILQLKEKRRNYGIKFSITMVSTQFLFLFPLMTRRISQFKGIIRSYDLFWLLTNRRKLLD